MVAKPESMTRRPSAGTARFYQTVHRAWWPEAGSEYQSSDRWAAVYRILQTSDLSCLLNLGFENLSSLLHLGRGLAIGRQIGIDIDAERVRRAREQHIEAYMCDISSERLPLDDGTVTCVYMGEVIEHLVDPDYAFEEIARVTRKGGMIVITTPNLASWYNRLLLLAGIQPLGTEVSSKFILGRKMMALGQMGRPVGHIRLFTLRALRDFLALYPLHDVQISGYSNAAIPFDPFFAQFAALSSGLVVRARAGMIARDGGSTNMGP